MKRRELVDGILKAGFICTPAKRHDKFEHPDGRVTFVPRHAKDVPIGLIKAIEKQTGLKLLK